MTGGRRRRPRYSRGISHSGVRMTDDLIMRFRLQQVAAYRDLCGSIRRSGRQNVGFAMLMLFLAYYSFQPGAGGIGQFVFILYAGLALAEFAVGLFKWVHPSAEGVLLDALILLLFAAWNLGWQGIAIMAGGPSNIFIALLGLYMLWGTAGRFRAYLQIRRLFADRPTRDQIAWFDELAYEIRTADPSTDNQALDLPTRPHWKAKLLGNIAFFVQTRGDAVVITGPGDFEIVRERIDHGTGHRKARFRMYEQSYPEFQIEDASWDNYRKWMAVYLPPPDDK